jgi:hypothetical protein
VTLYQPLAGPRAATAITALPTTVDLALYEGDDFYLDLVVTNPDGSAADLSTAVASAQVRTTADTTDPQAQFTATITGNVIHLHLDHIAASVMSNGVWDCQIATPDITTLAAGKVTVTQEVTRP